MNTSKEYFPEVIPELLATFLTNGQDVMEEVMRILNVYAKGHGRGTWGISQGYYFLGVTVSKVNHYPYSPEEVQYDRLIQAFWYNPKPEDPRDHFIIEKLDMKSFTMSDEEIIAFIEKVKAEDKKKADDQKLKHEQEYIEREKENLKRLMDKYPDVWKALAKS